MAEVDSSDTEKDVPKKSKKLVDDEAQIDRLLDYLREHRLSPVVEVVLAWLVACACLVYYGYSYIMADRHADERVPLVTESKNLRRQDLDAASLQKEILHALKDDDVTDDDVTDDDKSSAILKRIRSDFELKRKVTQFMQAPGCNQYPLYATLDSIWKDLLCFPPLYTETNQEHNPHIDLSLIIPAYKESGSQLRQTLQQAYRMCDNPDRVQVIIVDAGKCDDLKHLDDGQLSSWGHLRVVRFQPEKESKKSAIGRGPTLNFGAEHASGTFLTFLHSDTMVPNHWDTRVVRTLTPQSSSRMTHACAFSFGHHTSKEGLSGKPYPWGIRSVFVLGNLRAYLFSLPYGDHIISVPKAYFHHVGGYPEQPIMEDYELMDLLRKRAKILPERLRIIPPPTGHCSVRRWQTHGVVYTTLVNVLIVNRYKRGWTPDEIFRYYYQRPSKKKE